MTIVIPEDRYLNGAHYWTSWIDNNESVGTSGLDVYVTLPQKGFAYGIAAFGNPADDAVAYVFEFKNASAKGFGIGGRASTSGNTYQYRSRAHKAVLSEPEFGTNILLADLYIDDANERIVMNFDSNSGTQTLSARATFLVFKGDSV